MTLVTVLMGLSRSEAGLGRSLKGAVEGATATEQHRATRSMLFCGPRQYRVCIARPDKRRAIGDRRGRQLGTGDRCPPIEHTGPSNSSCAQ